MSVEFRVETATLNDLQLLQRWTAWAPGQGLPCVVGGERPADVFEAGHLRLICAHADDGSRVGISLVAAASKARGLDTWRLPNKGRIPADECLIWVGMAVAPPWRQSGVAPELVHRTLDMAATTGYPWVAAVFPVQDPRACALLVRSGFVKVDDAGAGRAAAYAVYVCQTPTLAEARVRTEIAC
jgi:GNAT superfamily N-acetyltransferase